jgi:hypothetical protein
VGLVVSEETGEISVAHRGHLVQGLDADGLSAFLTTTLTTVARRGNWLADLARRVFGNLLIREMPSSKEEGGGGAAVGFEDEVAGNGGERAGNEREEAQR